MQALEVIEQVLSFEEAQKRIPTDIKATHPYSVNALWTFYLDTEHQPEGESCPYCLMFDGQTFTGSQLRNVFPDHEWMGADIYPNVHKTLWGAKRSHQCGCLLIREDEKWGPTANLDLWSQLRTDWTEEKPKE